MYVTLPITRASTKSGTWTAASWVGSMVMDSPYTPAGSTYCAAYVAKASLFSAP